MNRTGTTIAGASGPTPVRLFDKDVFLFDGPRAADPMWLRDQTGEVAMSDTETIGMVHEDALPGAISRPDRTGSR